MPLQRLTFKISGPAFLLLVLLVPTTCKKQTSEPYDFSFAFLTDMHVQPELQATEGFMKAIRKVNQLKPDFVITGGDLIMDALGVSFERADSLYDLYTRTSEKMKMPVYNTMGNHEVFGYYPSSGVGKAHPFYGDKLYESRMGKRYYAFDHQNWRFYILDSVEEKEDGYGYYGYVDQEQLDWLQLDLASVDPATPIAISVHIPMITVQPQVLESSTMANPAGLVIVNSVDVLRLFGDHNLKLVLQGHLHRYEDIHTAGVHFITAGAVSGQWWKGARDAVEEGFLMVRVKGEEFRTEYVDYGWEVQQ